ncbi:MAG: desulfoferrodoxin [Candidatus Ratteibacteria bacterium]|nr:desulfoferrodoxin [Candidatus Ratteibacteria bacterium]
MCKCCCGTKKAGKGNYVCKICGREAEKQEVCCGQKMVEKKK